LEVQFQFLTIEQKNLFTKQKLNQLNQINNLKKKKYGT